MKKIGHYLFYLIEIAIVFALYTTLQEFYFYPDIFGFGSAEAFILALSTVLVFWFSFWLYKGQLDDDNDWGFSRTSTGIGGSWPPQSGALLDAAALHPLDELDRRRGLSQPAEPG